MEVGVFDDDVVAEPDPWPHQAFAATEVWRRFDRGCKRLLLTSPTGGGKSRMVRDIAKEALRRGMGVVLFANRKLLIEQTTRMLKAAGVEHGVRAAGHCTLSQHAAFQVCSIQTEYSRVVKRRNAEPHPCDLFVIDEAHLNENPQAWAVYKKYAATGAVKLGVTATPIDLGCGYDELVQAGTTSELRDCGALVGACHHGCTEPDMRNVRKIPVGEDPTEEENRKVIMVPGIHGVVIDHFRRLNPHGLPSIGFAPGVGESVGFAEAFEAAGIPAAHIDGDRVWIRGVERPSNEETRNELLAMSRTGQVRIVWNRFVLREAVDMPWLRHGVLATVFGSLQSYLQSGGRLLRSCPVAGKTSVVVQDHGGNWWRHGSLNADRIWRLGDTARSLAGMREDAIGGDTDNPPREPEPFLCPRCRAVLVVAGARETLRAECAACGHAFDFRRRSRPVIQADGELVEHEGAIFRPRRVERKPDTQAKWERIYWRAVKSSMTFRQARGLFFHENGYYPPQSLPLMPANAADWYMTVKKVPAHRLNPKTGG